eukprot:TRINITY_DN13111_c0_g1_i1.p1 TRINITY_DN13111_c0_g1~~TRINITY_DN13111_c0_g1_i1.p1  ORF type:complete len:159 (+),score=40.56 TRINITY_DN13111_c0_g1_i1:277-753(+)
MEEVLRGMLIPKLRNRHATAIAISIVGAVVMPHNLFLHSALVLSRKHSRTDAAIKDGCWYTLLETAIALSFAFLINVAVITVGGAVCHEPAQFLPPKEVTECAELTLINTPVLLQNTLSNWAGSVFGVALLASGQSSTITGTYAGQYVMQLEDRVSWL